MITAFASPSLSLLLGFALALGAQNSSDQFSRTDYPQLYRALKYRLIGPYRGGRSTAVAGAPSHPFTFYMGSTGGGIWKTLDAGENWENVSDGFIQAGSIGAIAVAKSDPNVIYVGTGSACPRGNISPGVGVYKSTDGGDTWKHVGLAEAGQVARVRVHPQDSNLFYVAVLGNIFGPNQERGVFRSRDGGKSFKKVLYLSDETGAVDLVMDINNPRVLYAAMWAARQKPWDFVSGGEEGGLYKTTDGGDSWERLGRGLPTGLVGRIGVTVSPANSKRVWAVIEAEEGALYRSDNAGKTWYAVNSEGKLRRRASYYMHIYADPVDEDTVYVLNTLLYKSLDGGSTFSVIPVGHGDCHDLWLNPNNPKIMIQANDGGAHISLTGGNTWSALDNQPTSEIYRVTVDNQFPYRVYGAQQDSNTISIPSWIPSGVNSPYSHWYSVGNCESGHIAVDPRNPSIVYAGCDGGVIVRTDLKSGQSQNVVVYPEQKGGEAARNLKYRFQWNAPVRLSPHNSDTVYHCSQVVHKSLDGGHSWDVISPDLTRNDKEKQDYAGGPITRHNSGVEIFNTIFAFEESPHQPGVLWAASDDGLVHISKNGGATWENVTPENMPEWGTVNMIEISAHAPGRAFIAVHRYRLNDFKPYIFRTNDYGQSWEPLTDSKNGVPENHFVRVIREDPDRKGLLYAGTEFGMYVSFDDGKQWSSLQLNLPVTPVTDLAVHSRDLVVATQGRSFWILDNLTLLHQITRQIAESETYLFRPEDTLRAQFQRFPIPWRDGAWGTVDGGERWGENPPNGVMIYYYFAKEPEHEVKIEILDSEDQLIQTYSSKAEKKEQQEDRDERPLHETPPVQDLIDIWGFIAKRSTVSGKIGLNRFLWTLRYPGAGNIAGPLALPGAYQVRLTVGSWRQTRSFQLIKDPRINATLGELRRQFTLLMQIRNKLNEIHDSIRKIGSVLHQVEDLSQQLAEARQQEEITKAAKSIGTKLTAIENRLTQTRNERSGDYLPPKLENQFSYLYQYVASAQAGPTAGAYERFQDLNTRLTQLSDRLQQVISTDLADFNKMVREKAIPAVIVPGKERE